MDYKGFVGGSYESQAVTFDSQRCINLFAEIDESQNGKGGKIGFLTGTPGLATKLTLPTPPGRIGGLYCASNGRGFAVSQDVLYEINTDWTYTERGHINTENGPICFTDNGIQMVLVDGQDGWVFTFSTNVLQRITDPDMPVADRCAFLDQSIVFNQVGTAKFYWSDVLDATSIDSLDFASAEGAPDLLLTLAVVHRQLWLGGTDTFEVWQNAGSAGFQRIDGVFVEHGCIAPQSLAILDNTLFWVGGGRTGHGIVWRAEGFMPKRISTHAVEYALSQYDLTDSYSYTYSESGHQFYVLIVPGMTTSFVYDVATGLWAERAGFTNGEFVRHRSNGYCYFNGYHVVNDYENGNIYHLDRGTYTDGGNIKKWLRASPYLAKDLKRVFHKRIQIDFQAGEGTVTGQGVTPEVMLRYTDDGRTWSPYRQAGIGALGNYLFRAYWSPLGSARSRAYEVSGTDPVKIAILSAEIEVEGGKH